MKDFLEYKGYIGSVHFSGEDEVFHGRLQGIRDLVTYEGTEVASLKPPFVVANSAAACLSGAKRVANSA